MVGVHGVHVDGANAGVSAPIESASRISVRQESSWACAVCAPAAKATPAIIPALKIFRAVLGMLSPPTIHADGLVQRHRGRRALQATSTSRLAQRVDAEE